MKKFFVAILLFFSQSVAWASPDKKLDFFSEENLKKWDKTLQLLKTSYLTFLNPEEELLAPLALTEAENAEQLRHQVLEESKKAVFAPESHQFLLHDPLYVDAFVDQNIVDGVWGSWFSREVLDRHKKAGWRMSHAENRVSTLSWIDTTHPSSFVIPLLHKNDFLFMKKKLGGDTLPVDPEGSFGFLYGKIAAGMVLEVADSKNLLMCFNKNFQRIPLEDTNQDRFFVVFGVSAGTQVLHLSIKGVHEKIAVKVPFVETTSLAVPVLKNVATYLDFSFYQVRSLQGRVLTEGYSFEQRRIYKRALSNASVTVVGSELAVAKSNMRGKFYIPHFLSVGAYPTYLETDRKGGYTHRYRILSRQDQVTLVRYPVQRISKWLQKTDQDFEPKSIVISRLSDSMRKKIKRKKRIQANIELWGASSEKEQKGSIHQVLKDETVQNTDIFSSGQENMLGLIHTEKSIGCVAFFDSPQETEMLWSEFNVLTPGVVTVLGMHTS